LDELRPAARPETIKIAAVSESRALQKPPNIPKARAMAAVFAKPAVACPQLGHLAMPGPAHLGGAATWSSG
jgi:hypothetical protein